MFSAAAGRYVVAVDDDDIVAPHYIRALPLAAEVDFIGYDILWMEDGQYAGIVRHSLQGDPMWRTLDRGVSPKCPVATDLARFRRFGNEYTADRVWSMAIFGDARTGVYVPESLYIYDHWNEHMVGTEPDDYRASRPQRDVGQWPFAPERFTWL
jgi:hypothetical protein